MTTRRVLSLLCALAASGAASAHGGAPCVSVSAELAASAGGPRDPPATDLGFAEMYRMPIGPRGLEPSAKLLSLDGQRVRLVGYMASTGAPVAGWLVLTPLPVSLGDEDESLSDDLPASVVFVHLSSDGAAQRRVPNLSGLLQLTGTLRLGAQQEPDGHVSAVRLLLDAADSRRLVEAGGAAAAAAAAAPWPHPNRRLPPTDPPEKSSP